VGREREEGQEKMKKKKILFLVEMNVDKKQK